MREDDCAAVGALGDPVRRRLYDLVGTSEAGLGRDDLATQLDLAPHVVRFHLDRLVEVGLLRVERRRLTGRSGPGAGRPANIYRRGHDEVSVSLPPRRYDVLGHVLAAAVQQSLEGADLAGALSAAAREAGARDAGAAGEVGSGDDLDRAAAVLAGVGFEPRREGRRVELRNCPFDAQARTHPTLVCGVNRDYVSGVTAALGCRRTRTVLDPAPGRCCVLLETGAPATGSS